MPTREELKKRLANKIEAKKKLRSSKKVALSQRTLRVNNNEDIRNCAISLMMEVEKVIRVKGPQTSIIALDKIFAKKYDFLKKKYFAIYRAVLARELPIEVLDMMLSQKSRIDNKEISEEKASLQMGNIFAKKLNVDIDALTESAKKMQKEQGN